MAVRRRLPSVIGVCSLLVQAWASVGQIATWQGDLTLWSHAATTAPLKPRVVQNLGLSLVGAGHVTAGLAQLDLALLVAQRPHVPETDRLITERTVALNLAAIRAALR